MTNNELSDIESMLLDGAEGFLASIHSFDRVRLHRHRLDVTSHGVWRGMAECGWLAMSLPESLGGAGLGVGSAARLGARLGEALLPEPFAECSVAPSAILAVAPHKPEVEQLAHGLSDGSARPALAWQSNAGQLDPDWGARIDGHGEAMRLSGSFEWVAADATHLLVAANFQGQPAILIVTADAEGVGFRPQNLADGSTTASLVCERVAIGQSQMLLNGELARNALAGALDDARLVLSAHLCGIASGALKMTISYLQQRVQFGHPIASFQAVRHRVVDLEIQKRLAFASWQHARDLRSNAETSPVNISAAISAAKARCSEIALTISRAAIQLHGAIGYTQEANIGLFLDAAMTQASRLGNAALHRRRFVDLTVLNNLA
jgi:alkylation response protein AidB-like acyl-CoA dehydrogenase